MSDEGRSIFDEAEPPPDTNLDALAEWRRAERWQARAERAEARVAELESVIESDPELARRYRGRWRKWLGETFGIHFTSMRALRGRQAHMERVNRERAAEAKREAEAPLPTNHMRPKSGWSPVRNLSEDEKREAWEELQRRNP